MIHTRSIACFIIPFILLLSGCTKQQKKNCLGMAAGAAVGCVSGIFVGLAATGDENSVPKAAFLNAFNGMLLGGSLGTFGGHLATRDNTTRMGLFEGTGVIAGSLSIGTIGSVASILGSSSIFGSYWMPPALAGCAASITWGGYLGSSLGNKIDQAWKKRTDHQRPPERPEANMTLCSLSF